MDRMSFIPGAPHREYIENAAGHIFFGRPVALDFADTFLSHPSHNILYQLVSACLSEGDQVDIWFGARDPRPDEASDPDGEPVGHTWATLTADAQPGSTSVLWDVGRDTAPVLEGHAVRAFNAYRRALAEYQGVPAPTPLPVDSTSSGLADLATISRCFSPANLYECAGIMWYFVDLSGTVPSRDSAAAAGEATLSRPMPARDAIVLATLLTLALGAPPMVFAVLQSAQPFGRMPRDFQRAVYGQAGNAEADGGQIVIIC
jgi:hypothetical protein